MKSTFYFPYVGGKSKEIKEILKYIDLNKYTTIVEPFCGSSAFSYYFWQHGGEHLRYHLNDIDPNLFNFLSDVKQNGSQQYFDFCSENWNAETTKEQYNTIIRQEGTKAWFYRNRICNIRHGLYPSNKKKSKFNLNPEDYQALDNFYQSENVKLSNDDFNTVLEQYKNDKKALIFVDPPYFLSDNSFYRGKGMKFGGNQMTKDEYVDPTGAYIYLKNAFANSKAKIIMIINECELLRSYFRKFFKESYAKTYQMTKNKTRHMVISNINNKKICA